MKEKLIKHRSLLILLFINVLIYVPVILFFPGFLADDFLIFQRINLNPNDLISFNHNEYFSLFLRPISYFSFWLDYKLFDSNYILIKLVSFSLHLLSLSLFYLIINKIQTLFGVKISKGFIFLVLVFFSFHPDVQIWVYWIANKTELLAFLFYVLSFVFLLVYLDKRSNTFFILMIISYLISVLSKQNGLHFPLLLMILWFLNKKNNYVQLNFERNSKILIVFLFLVFFLFLYFNIIFTQGSNSFFSSVWKKPFSFFGILVFVLVPFNAQSVYNIFLFNKSLVFIPLVIIVVLLFLNRKRISWRLMSRLLIFMIIVNFPRVFAATGGRINSLFVFWIIITILFFYYKYNNFVKSGLAIFFLVFSIISLYTLYTSYLTLKNESLVYEKFTNIVNTSLNEPTFSCTYPELVFINYRDSYYKRGTFKYYSANINSPVYYSYSLIDNNSLFYKDRVILARLVNNIIYIKTLNPLIMLLIDGRVKNSKILSTKPDLSGRGYSEVTYELPTWLDLKKTKLIYFDGKDWLTLN